MISIPRFGEGSSKQAVNKFSSTSEAWQEFCEDCLRYKYPNFYVFSTLGRDGAIDGVQDHVWAECKLCSEDKASSIIQQWKETEKALWNQLAKGEENCQKQYRPWYSSNSSIEKYILFTNAQLPNENAVQYVKRYISNVFYELSNLNPKLRHLVDVKIEIWHWRRIVPLIRENTSLLNRWFWESWPPGMVPLNIEQEGGFRTYLQSSKLPYYSLESYERESQKRSPIKTESEVLVSFLKSEKIGRIIIGQAGIGKTRMALQIGVFAVQNGWIVYRVNSSIQLSAIDNLFQNLHDADKVLLVIDYVELMDSFKGFVEELDNYNKKYGRKVFYIATCRYSYFRRVIAEVYTHEPINLNINPLDDWISGYRQAVVNHILKSSKFPNKEEYIPICKGMPILAVLIVYLYENKRSTDIKDILKSVDFGIWFSKHLKLTLPFMEDSLIAKFMLCLPISEQILARMPPDIEIIKNKLSADGWIESTNDKNRMRNAIHDVVSDGIVISYCQSIGNEVQSFIKKAIEFARTYHSLASLLVAFERIIDNEALYDVDWYSLITNEIIKYPDEWKKHRFKLLITSLLDESQQIMLFSENPNYWNDLSSELLFHQTIGWLIGWLAREENQDSQRIVSLRRIIDPFISPCLVNIKNNYLICRALEFCPQKYYTFASEWIKMNPGNPKLSYVLGAYIRSGQYDKELEEQLAEWFIIHPTDYESYHILKALFKVRKTSKIEAGWLNRWLSMNHKSLKANMLLTLFMDSGGDFNYIKQYYFKNLMDPEQSSSALFCLRQLVHYEDNVESIEPSILTISPEDDLTQPVVDIISSIVSKRNISTNLKNHCLKWCKRNPTNLQSLWNLKKLLWKNYDEKLVREFIDTLEIILCQIDKEGLSINDYSTLNCIIYKLLYKTYQNSELYSRALTCFKQCLIEIHSFTNDIRVFDVIQNRIFFYALIQLLQRGMLIVDKDYESIQGFVEWYKRWEPKNKGKVFRQINWLDHDYSVNFVK